MKSLRNFSWIVLINIFLVIIAGSVVRMTGSGMGCPDWPKCFGHYIPPTSIEELTWEQGKSFDKNQMVIMNESLWTANEDLVAQQEFNNKNWTKYTKHDYAKFNVYHTWTEYINRLFGALLGVFALIVIVLAANKFRTNKWFLWLALIQLFLVLFQAWLGKLTVDTNLNPYMITYHMMGVVVMIVVQLVLIKLVNSKVNNPEGDKVLTSKIKGVSLLGVGLMIVQIVLGTQVRQQTDTMTKAGVPRELIADGFDWVFFVHRSFSFLIIFACVFLFIKLRKLQEMKAPLRFLIIFTILEVIAGMVLYYLGMKPFAQPIHLLFSLLMYAFFVELFIRMIPRLSLR